MPDWFLWSVAIGVLAPPAVSLARFVWRNCL
jgi:hypothetical protein